MEEAETLIFEFVEGIVVISVSTLLVTPIISVPFDDDVEDEEEEEAREEEE